MGSKAQVTSGRILLPAIFFIAVFLAGSGVGRRAQRGKSAVIDSTFDHDAKALDLQWVKNLTNLNHQRTKFAVVFLMRVEDLVTRRWMGEGKSNKTTIFLLSDGKDVNSLQKVVGNMYGLTVLSNASRDAGACNLLPIAWHHSFFDAFLANCLLLPAYFVCMIITFNEIRCISDTMHGHIEVMSEQASIIYHTTVKIGLNFHIIYSHWMDNMHRFNNLLHATEYQTVFPNLQSYPIQRLQVHYILLPRGSIQKIEGTSLLLIYAMYIMLCLKLSGHKTDCYVCPHPQCRF